MVYTFVMVQLFCVLGFLIYGVSGFCSDGLVMENRSLVDFDFSRSKCVGLYDCAARCLSHGMCQSFTFEKEDKICALSSANSSFPSNNLISADGYYFSDIENWESTLAGLCSEQPCPRVQQCSVSKKTTALCDQPPLGLRCSADADCAQFGRSECHSGFCICTVGFYLKGGESQCRPVIGSVCDDDADCEIIPNAFCNEGRCTCNIGYSFDANQISCRSNTDCNDFTSSFTSFSGKAIMYHDADVIDDISNADCQSRCISATFTCKAYEYDAGTPKCYLNDVAWLEVPDNHVEDELVVYNNRDCNWWQ